jgi:hypothetical protein
MLVIPTEIFRRMACTSRKDSVVVFPVFFAVPTTPMMACRELSKAAAGKKKE